MKKRPYSFKKSISYTLLVIGSLTISPSVLADESFSDDLIVSEVVISPLELASESLEDAPRYEESIVAEPVVEPSNLPVKTEPVVNTQAPVTVLSPNTVVPVTPVSSSQDVAIADTVSTKPVGQLVTLFQKEKPVGRLVRTKAYKALPNTSLLSSYSLESKAVIGLIVGFITIVVGLVTFANRIFGRSVSVKRGDK